MDHLGELRKKLISMSFKKKINEENVSKKDDSEVIKSKDLIKSNINSIRAVALIRAYRQRGHLLAKLDPLEMMQTEYLDELHPEYHGFKKEDYKEKIYLDGVTNKEHSTVREDISFFK